ncbi:MAG: hypothetical protein H6831_09250 [Planctomycetes bacterium]|nr:hypothetical protein [Planctomycetota bacterium]MCB9904579.1 hypothetical protein [Planctomycetota bacterium]
MDARKDRYGAKDLDRLFAGSNKLIAVRGKKAQSFDLKKGGYDRAELEKSVLGPTGNLRAPAMRMGKNWLVGFGEETYDEVFGK